MAQGEYLQSVASGIESGTTKKKEVPMDLDVERVLAQLEKREEAENEIIATLPLDQYMKRRDEFMVSIGRDTGLFINMLLKSAKARRILELGTSCGYSTLWLAEAAREIGGTITTIEANAEKLCFARGALISARLDTHVDFQLGDAPTLIATLGGSFDFVLLDLWKELYVDSFDLFHDKLAPGSITIADNMLRPERYQPMVKEYRARVRSIPGFSSVLVPIGNGIELSRREN